MPSFSAGDSLFLILVRHAGLPVPTPEYRFHPVRRWRVDYAWPDRKLAVEIEGGAWTGGRHTRGEGFLGDIEKYNALAYMGWRLLRFTPPQIKSGEFLEILRRCLETEGDPKCISVSPTDGNC